jgi:hypothetical protein
MWEATKRRPGGSSEREALARFLRSAINADRYPRSPRLAPLKAILAKPDPQPQAQPVPPPAATPSGVMTRKRRWGAEPLLSESASQDLFEMANLFPRTTGLPDDGPK